MKCILYIYWNKYLINYIINNLNLLLTNNLTILSTLYLYYYKPISLLTLNSTIQHKHTNIGIDAIKEALLTGEADGSIKEAPVKIRLIAPPMYVLTTTTLDKELGILTLNNCIDIITRIITSKG